MNHPSIIEHESMRLYRNRSYILSDLDDRHFEALNTDGHVIGLNGYCIDALDDVPSGSMTWIARWPAINFVDRESTFVEREVREALAKQLVAEILAEEQGR